LLEERSLLLWREREDSGHAVRMRSEMEVWRDDEREQRRERLSSAEQELEEARNCKRQSAAAVCDKTAHAAECAQRCDDSESLRGEA